MVEPSICKFDEAAEETDTCFANEGCVGDSGDLLAAQMLSPTCDSEISLSRCSSTSSLVTYAQPLEPDDFSSDQQSASTDTNEEATESFGTRWTDDKHSSYLSSMEATFVKNLYDREYCALDICGQAPRHMDYEDPDCAESEPKLASEFQEFNSCQNGYWRPKVLAKRRFRHQFSRKAHARSQKETKFVNSHLDFEESEIAEPQKHVGLSFPQDLEACAGNVVELWLERLNSHRFTSSSTPGVQNGKNCPISPVSTESDREISALKQQPKHSTCCKRFNTGFLWEECQDVDAKIRRSSKAGFEQRPFRKQKTYG